MALPLLILTVYDYLLFGKDLGVGKGEEVRLEMELNAIDYLGGVDWLVELRTTRS